MGILVIQLKEGKNLAARDLSGTSDPFVKFQVVSNAELQAQNDSSFSNYNPFSSDSSGSKVKSRVIKKTLNPVWNETLTIQMPNNPKGFSLMVGVLDWNLIGQNESLGDGVISLDDLKPSEPKDIQLNLHQGSIYFALTHKADFKSKVNIYFENESTPFTYELLRGVKISTQLEVLCQLVKATKPSESYALQLRESEVILTDQHLNDTKYDIPENTDIRLIIKPNLQVMSTLQALKNEQTQKKAIFDLKKQLEQSEFAKEFLAQGGVTCITDMIIEATGNTLAYALSALDQAMTYGFGWDSLSPQVIEKLMTLMDSTNLNVRSGAMKIAGHLAGSKNHGYPAVTRALKKLESESKGPGSNVYCKIITNFNSSLDVNIQWASLIFINNMLLSAPETDKADLVKFLESNFLTKALKKQMETATDNNYRAEILRYLRIKNDLEGEPTPYNKENKDHEEMLMTLWKTVFPDTKLETRVSEQWKLFGFQGTDPATDFRGMGILGLKHLLYFAKNYTDDFRAMIQHQVDNNDTYYPIAVASINLTKILYDIFGVIDESHAKYFGILFDHEFALQEIYSIALKFFDQMWDEMEATYFNFNQVKAVVEEQIITNLDQVTTLEQFRASCAKGIPKEDTKGDDKNKSKGEKKKKGILGFKKFTSKVVSAKKSESHTLLHEAVKVGNTKKVAELLRDGISVNVTDDKLQSALHLAVQEKNLEMVRLLLWKDANVDLKNNKGWTPLHEACKASTLEIIDVLLHRGANPNVETADGVSPLHYLVTRKFGDPLFHKEVLNEMLERGAEINNCKNQNQETPLHYAVVQNCLEGASFLLEHNCDTNLKNKRNYTALHIAILQNNPNMVKLLLQYKADTSIPCKEGSTLDITKDKAILDMLKNADKIYEDAVKERQAKIQPTVQQQVSNNQADSQTTQRGGAISTLKSRDTVGRSISADLLKQLNTQLKQRINKDEEALSISCFHDIGQTESNEILDTLKTSGVLGVLLRPSSVRGCYVLVLAQTDHNLHLLVYPKSGGGYAIEESDDLNTYTSLVDLVQKTPLVVGKTPITHKNMPAIDPDEMNRKAVENQLKELRNVIDNTLQALRDKQTDWKDSRQALKNSLSAVGSLLQ